MTEMLDKQESEMSLNSSRISWEVGVRTVTEKTCYGSPG